MKERSSVRRSREQNILGSLVPIGFAITLAYTFFLSIWGGLVLYISSKIGLSYLTAHSFLLVFLGLELISFYTNKQSTNLRLMKVLLFPINKFVNWKTIESYVGLRFKSR